MTERERLQAGYLYPKQVGNALEKDTACPHYMDTTPNRTPQKRRQRS